MTQEMASQLTSILSTMKAADRWTSAHALAYYVGLEDLPDEAALILRREILRQWEWRPSVKEVRALWAKIAAPTEAVSAETVVAQLYALRDRWGAAAAPMPGFEDRYPNLRAKGEPAWTDPIKRRVVAALGGWVAFCEDDSPAGVMRGHLLKVSAMVLAGEGDGDIRRLRQEFHERRAALPAPEHDDTAWLEPGLPAEGGDGGGELIPLRAFAPQALAGGI